MPRWIAPFLAAAAMSAQPIELPVWSGDAPGSEGKPNVEVIEKGADGERRTRLVTRPTITVHLPPADKATGTAILIAPGGGYRHHAIDKEGHDVAKWLNTIGVAGIVLKYRVMTAEMAAQPASPSRTLRGVVSEWALADAKRAMRIVRSRAAEWRIRPDRIGFMGFSAGGHLTASLCVQYDRGDPKAKDPVERQSSLPTFAGILYGAAPEPFAPSKDAPHAFIAHANDDRTVPVAASTRMFEAFKKVDVPAEVHLFESGGHGFGIRKTGKASDVWPEKMREWLKFFGYLGGK